MNEMKCGCGLFKRAVVIDNGVWPSDGSRRLYPFFICVSCDLPTPGEIPNVALLHRFDEGRDWLNAHQSE